MKTDRPECPNCLRPEASPEDNETYKAMASGAEIPDGWADEEGTHLCWVHICGRDECQPPPDLRLTTAEIRDLRAEVARLTRERDEAQAACAAMRRDLGRIMATVTDDGEDGCSGCGHDIDDHDGDCPWQIAADARGGLAGRELLERMEQAEQARDAAQAQCVALVEAFEAASVIARETWQRERARADAAESLLMRTIETPGKDTTHG